MMRVANGLLFIVCLSFLFLRCSEKTTTTSDSYSALKINEAYIQEEVPGQEDQVSKWMFSIQVDPNVKLESLVLGDEEYGLVKNGSKYSTQLKNRIDSEKDIPEIRYIKFWSDGKLKNAKLSNIELKEALYMP